MTRTVKTVGGIVTAIAVVVVLGFAYLARSPSPSSTAPATTSTARTSNAGCTVPSSGSDGLVWVCLTELPRQAGQTVMLIDAGGPFPYEKDGAVFANFEGRLPERQRGYYREYTVPTPGERDRGARRMVTGDHDRELF